MPTVYKYDQRRGLFVCNTVCHSTRPFLAINWNIVGGCVNACTYCYGKDIRNLEMPSDEQTAQMTSALIGLEPDLVVLTGGEPLLCPSLTTVIKMLTDAGIPCLLDTSSLPDIQAVLKEKLAERIHFRISLDSDIPEINESTRASRIPNSTKTVKRNIALLTARGIPLTVQTTVTEENLPHLTSLGEYISRTGVENWRLSVVIPHKDILPEKADRAVGRLRAEHPHLKIRLSNARPCGGYHIVLLDPTGRLWIRGNRNNEKLCLGSLVNGGLPRRRIVEQIDIERHTARYLVSEE